MGLIGIGTLQNSKLGHDESGVTACECQMRKLVRSGSPGLSPPSCSWLE